MKKNCIYLYIPALLSMVVPTPARTGYGILMLLIFNVVMLLGTTAKILIKKIDLGDLETVCLIVFMYSVTIICKQLLILFSPVEALVLSYAVYLIPVSSFLIGHIIVEENLEPKQMYAVNMQNAGTFTALALLFYLIREILAFQSISLPGRYALHILHFSHAAESGQFFFWATIPGSFVIFAVILALNACIQRKIENNRRKD